MTRVEKYRKYREEIEHFCFDEQEKTKKEQSSELVDEILKDEKRTTKSFAYDELMEIHKVYVDEPEETKKKLTSAKKKQILFVIICSVVIIGLLIGLILVGIKAFGGN